MNHIQTGKAFSKMRQVMCVWAGVGVGACMLHYRLVQTGQCVCCVLPEVHVTLNGSGVAVGALAHTFVPY